MPITTTTTVDYGGLANGECHADREETPHQFLLRSDILPEGARSQCHCLQCRWDETSNHGLKQRLLSRSGWNSKYAGWFDIIYTRRENYGKITEVIGLIADRLASFLQLSNSCYIRIYPCSPYRLLGCFYWPRSSTRSVIVGYGWKTFVLADTKKHELHAVRLKSHLQLEYNHIYCYRPAGQKTMLMLGSRFNHNITERIWIRKTWIYTYSDINRGSYETIFPNVDEAVQTGRFPDNLVIPGSTIYT